MNAQDAHDDFDLADEARYTANDTAAEMADPDDEPGICGNCNGSGEGRFDGTTCWSCKGSGETA